MRVFGFNDGLDVVAIDLPDEWVAEFGIDAWRLDIFEQEPLTMNFECADQKRKLHFRKLKDISFSYNQGATTFVGVHDGVKAICFSYSPENPADITISDRPFSEHYLAYLNSGWEHEEAGSSNAYVARSVIRPWPAGAVTLRGNTVHWDNQVERLPFDRRKPMFVDGSVTENALPIKVPASVSWIFERLRSVNPIVANEAIVQFLSGAEPDELDVYVQWDKLNLTKHLLTTDPVNGVCFGHRKANASFAAICAVDGRDQRIYVTAANKGTALDGVRAEHGAESIRGLYCANDREVRGTRLQFLNLAKQRQR